MVVPKRTRPVVQSTEVVELLGFPGLAAAPWRRTSGKHREWMDCLHQKISRIKQLPAVSLSLSFFASLGVV